MQPCLLSMESSRLYSHDGEGWYDNGVKYMLVRDKNSCYFEGCSDKIHFWFQSSWDRMHKGTKQATNQSEYLVDFTEWILERGISYCTLKQSHLRRFILYFTIHPMLRQNAGDSPEMTDRTYVNIMIWKKNTKKTKHNQEHTYSLVSWKEQKKI